MAISLEAHEDARKRAIDEVASVAIDAAADIIERLRKRQKGRGVEGSTKFNIEPGFIRGRRMCPHNPRGTSLGS